MSEIIDIEPHSKISPDECNRNSIQAIYKMRQNIKEFMIKEIENHFSDDSMRKEALKETFVSLIHDLLMYECNNHKEVYLSQVENINNRLRYYSMYKINI